MAFNIMFASFASISFIILFLAFLKFFKSKSRELLLPPGTLGWPYIGETFQLYSHYSNVFASKQKRYGSIFKTHILGRPFVMISSSGAAITRGHLFEPAFPASEESMSDKQAIFSSQGQYHAKLSKLVLRALMPKAIKSIVSNIKSIAKDSLQSMKGRLITTFQEMKTPGLVAFPKSMKKVDVLVKKAKSFALTLLLLSAQAAGKPPTLDYGIIKNNNNAPPSTSTHPPPINDPTRGCNDGNYCRHFTLTAENPSGTTRIEAVAKVDVGAPLNHNAPGLEAIASGIATWSLNNTKSGRLSVSMNATADADSALVLQLKLAVSRGIARMGLDVEYSSTSMSSGEKAALPPVDGNITITVGAAINRVDLKFMTHVESFGETDVVWILDYAKAILARG